MSLSVEELSRYSRQIILPQIGQEGQERLKKSSVLLVGMGGLGGPASLYLAAAGIGRLGLADFDEVELSNLHRQIIHSSRDIGRSKLQSAAHKLQALNPHCHIHLHPDGVQAEELPRLFKHYDIIVDGSDNFTTRYMVNDAAVMAGKPLVYGSIFQFEGQASLFYPKGGGACYRCLFPEMPDPSTVPNCAEGGVLGALCGIVGSIQAMEAIKFLTGAGENLLNRLIVMDALAMRPRVLNTKPDPECPVCSANPKITSIRANDYIWTCAVPEEKDPEPMEITVEEGKAMVERGDAVILDVREPFELAIASVPGSLNIPLRQLMANGVELPRDRTILTLCHHGMRSMSAARELQARGYNNVRNLRGGIDQWAQKIDPKMERY